MKERLFNFLCWLTLFCCMGIVSTILISELIRRFYWDAQ
jgi:hypothetical protein